MGLPTNNQVKMIPDSWKPIFALYAEHDAWYSGDIARLAAFYAGRKNYHWSQNPYESRRSAVHIPIAGDLATASADLLFSEAPKYEISEAQDAKNIKAIAADKRLTEIVEKGNVANKLLEAAETCAALGGVYLKVNWNAAIAKVPLLSIAQADSAIPEFSYGYLQAVTFWKIIGVDGDVVYRLIERQEKGKIFYGLYKGDKDLTGEQISLEAHPQTAGYASVVNELGYIDTKIDDILVRYIPNIKPNRKFRGSEIGQSDLSGAEALMDALDETFSSWMRDIRLGQGRLIVNESMLEFKDGKAGFNVDKEIFVGLEGASINDQGGTITIAQFEIRTQQHLDTAKQLLERIISSAGYSPQSFGINISGSSESGTALNIREKKTAITRAKKEKYWTTALEDIFHLMLQVDNIHLGNNTPMEFRPNVELADISESNLMQLAATIVQLNAAQAISIDTKVRMAHPDWDETQIVAEINRIKEEQGIVIPSIADTQNFGV